MVRDDSLAKKQKQNKNKKNMFEEGCTHDYRVETHGYSCARKLWFSWHCVPSDASLCDRVINTCSKLRSLPVIDHN